MEGSFYFFALANIAILIVVHEFGHFLVAKACGVSVPVFSVGFGRRLWGVQIGETDYRVSSLPFGGYVQMAGADPYGYYEEDHDLDDPERGFLRRPLWQRIAILLAGPAANVLYAVVVLSAALMWGEPQAAPVLGEVMPDTPAEEMGLVAGDEVVAVDGAPVRTFNELVGRLGKLQPGEHTFDVEREGDTLSLPLVLDDADREGSGVFGVGYYPWTAEVGVDDPTSPAGVAGVQTGWRIEAVQGQAVGSWQEAEAAVLALGSAPSIVFTFATGDEGRPKEQRTLQSTPAWRPHDGSALGGWGLAHASLFVRGVVEEVSDAHGFLAGCRPPPPGRAGPAFAAGIQAGDRILQVDDTPVTRWNDVTEGVAATLADGGDVRPVDIVVRRGGQELTLAMTPEVVVDNSYDGTRKVLPRIGIQGRSTYRFDDLPEVHIRHAATDAVSQASATIGGLAAMVVTRIGQLITGEAAFDHTLGGPVAMFSQGALAASMGLFAMASFSASISLSLGVVNLFPVPVLDGGQILFFVIEAVRGRPLSAAMRERVLQIAVLGMVMLMLAVTIKDLDQFIRSLFS